MLQTNGSDSTALAVILPGVVWLKPTRKVWCLKQIMFSQTATATFLSSSLIRIAFLSAPGRQLRPSSIDQKFLTTACPLSRQHRFLRRLTEKYLCTTAPLVESKLRFFRNSSNFRYFSSISRNQAHSRNRAQRDRPIHTSMLPRAGDGRLVD